MHFKKECLRIAIIEYLADHWSEEIPLGEIAAKYQYTDRYFNVLFKECFGLPYVRYMTKLRIHRAACRISKTQNIMEAGRMIGYASAQSFSKAFRKELGVSPRQFLKSTMEVPDMPLCYRIKERPVSLHYVTTVKRAVYGKMTYVTQEGETRFWEAGNLCNDCFVWEKGERVHQSDTVEVWWNDEQGRVCRMAGQFLTKETRYPVRDPIITLQKDYYAVLSIPYDENAEEDERVDIIKEILQHVVPEWVLINDKEIRQMGYLFICCEEGRIKIHIPVHKRAVGMKNRAPQFRGAAAWVQYIDDTIRENLTVPMLAEAFNYSERHFTDTFEMYFGVRPGLYIKKRKLYLAAKELAQGQKNIEKIVNSYGFPSLSAFRKGFYEEFSCYPEEYNEKEYKADNLKQQNTYDEKQNLLTIVEEEDILIAGRNVSSDGRRREDQGDLIESIAWYLCYVFEETDHASGQNEKIVVWQTAKDRIEHYCLVGQRIEREEDFDRFHPDLYEKVYITGGTYAVMETTKPSDQDSLVETYREMYRSAFGVWLRENREKLDLTRLTFVKYKNEKLYFYIPIYA